MNLLLCAYACAPNEGSEPEVGWRMVTGIANQCPTDTVFVITKGNNSEGISSEVYPENLKFIYYSAPKWLSFWKKGGRGVRTYYYLWMIGAVLLLKKKKLKFDIIHHVTFVNDWLPSFFFLLKGERAKFIWGPIGSHDPIDKKFLDGPKKKLVEIFRISLQFLFRNFDPFFLLCKRNSDFVFGINDNVRRKVGLVSKGRFFSEPAIGIDAPKSVPKQKHSGSVFKLVSVGRLLYIKNFKLTLLAFSKFLGSKRDGRTALLTIVGGGAELHDLIAYAEVLGISKYVEFVGNVPLQEVDSFFSSADIFLFPTLENAGFVVLEAMSHGLPIIAMNYGGPAQFVTSYVDQQLVSSESDYEKIADDLARNIHRFYEDDKLRCAVGSANYSDVVSKCTWDEKVKRVVAVYESL